jgi:hypothetical protein
MLLTLPTERKFLLVVLVKRYREKSIFQSVVAYQAPGDTFIFLRKKITFGTAATVGVAT